MKLFDDTIKMNAMFYLTSDGDEVTRDDLLREIRDGYPVYMVYLGGGFVPLTLAVQAFTSASEAYGAVEEWARKAYRFDEIGEDVPCRHCKTVLPGISPIVEVPVQMDWTDGLTDKGVPIWQCPECNKQCPQPCSYGEVELRIQRVPESILETAWVLERPFAGQLVHIWSATTKHTEDVPSLTIEDIDDLAGILSEEQMNDLQSVYEVVTDSPKIKELI